MVENEYILRWFQLFLFTRRFHFLFFFGMFEFWLFWLQNDLNLTDLAKWFKSLGLDLAEMVWIEWIVRIICLGGLIEKCWVEMLEFYVRFE